MADLAGSHTKDPQADPQARRAARMRAAAESHLCSPFTAPSPRSQLRDDKAWGPWAERSKKCVWNGPNVLVL